MTPTATASQSFTPRLDARQSLQKLLDLIRDTKSIQDIGIDRLRSVFGLPFVESEGRYGFAERLDRDWWSSYEWDPARANGAQFEFAFRPGQPEQDPDAGAICALDFDRFAAELEAQGFARETYRGEHGRPIHDRFERPDLAVTVYTRGESSASPDKIAHACVLMVHIR